MSSLSNIYIKLDTLKTMVKALETKNKPGVEITISVSDEANKFSQNVSGFVAQTKEEREAKKPKFYVGNGNTFWTDGKITVVKKELTTIGGELPDESGLPF
jgi:hypothetical protein